MSKGTLTVAGIGPGGQADMTQAVVQALRQADCVVGYKYYLQFVEPLLPPTAARFATGMRGEVERAREALRRAASGQRVVMISSGDANIYGMGALLYELRAQRAAASDGAHEPAIEVLPGISAFQKAAALLGAPLGGDFCVISLSDLLTPWPAIERRIVAAAEADFVTCVYNPRSHERYWQLPRLRELFLRHGRPADTPVGIVRQAGRAGQRVWTTTLAALCPDDIDMFCILLIGNSLTQLLPRGCGAKADEADAQPDADLSQPDADLSQSDANLSQSAADLSQSDADLSQSDACLMVTSRGYDLAPGAADAQSGAADTQPDAQSGGDAPKVGQRIMRESFGSILSELSPGVLQTCPRDRLWLLLHAIHTTADFDMQRLLYADPHVLERVYGHFDTIVTDVTMARSGIRKGALQRLGIAALCYLEDERVAAMAQAEGITRTQAGIRLAVAEHPTALYAFGNAPTALMELCRLIRTGAARPAGVVAAPVGFVHVEQSKHMVKAFADIPKIVVEGRKGGSNLAATLCNAVLAWPDAATLLPGRDL